MPQKAVALVGEHEGNGCLRIAVCKLKHTVLHVKQLLLILSHSEQLFFRVRMEGHCQLMIASEPCLKMSGMIVEGSAVSLLPQKQLSLLVVEADPAAFLPGTHLKPGRDLAVRDASLKVILNPDLHLRLHRCEQCIVRIPDLSHHDGPNPQGILSPGLYPQPLSCVFKYDCVLFL